MPRRLRCASMLRLGRFINQIDTLSYLIGWQARYDRDFANNQRIWWLLPSFKRLVHPPGSPRRNRHKPLSTQSSERPRASIIET